MENTTKLINLSEKCWNWYNDLLSNNVVKNAFKTEKMPEAMRYYFLVIMKNIFLQK